MSDAGRPGRTRRLALALVIAAMAGSLSLSSVAAATLANAVSWSKDDVEKTITAEVRITVTPTCATPQFQAARFGEARASWCDVTAEAAAQIKANIESIWNGNKYYCYDVIVKVDIKVDNDPSGPDPTKRIKVRLDQTAAPPVAHVASPTKGAGTTWDGNSPSDAVRPLNNGTGSSTWPYPPGEQGANVYAHE